MTPSHSLPALRQWFARLAAALDRRSAPGLALLFLGAVWAWSRWAVTSWNRAAMPGDEPRPGYTTVAAGASRTKSSSVPIP
jgi:hypothetical protein